MECLISASHTLSDEMFASEVSRLLEFHHVVPYAEGGETTASNIELRCRRHNRFEAERWFGGGALPAMVREAAPEWRSGPNATGIKRPLIETA